MSRERTAKAVNERLLRAKATTEYRRMNSSIEKAVWLHTEHGIPQKLAAKSEQISRGALQRGVIAIANNRPIGVNGRPSLLSHEQVREVEQLVMSRARSLNSMSVAEVGFNVCQTSWLEGLLWGLALTLMLIR